MCGRYYYDEHTIEYVNNAFPELREPFPAFPAFGNQFGNQREPFPGRVAGDIVPSLSVPAIFAAGDNTMTGGLLTWGFPGFDGKGLLINARSESAAQKRTFSDSLQNRRCVLPAAGFYEWDRKKDKVSFTLSGCPVIYLAGIFRWFEEEPRFVILTRAANASMMPVHDRMPLMIPENEVASWILDRSVTEHFLENELPALTAQREFEQMTMF